MIVSPKFFIDRPVFAWVIALTILLAGFSALRVLPVEQYPSIAPPSLSVSVNYPGADASVLETNVTQVIEQAINGVEGFLYMTSSSESNGRASITVTFESGTDIDLAQVDVQNRLRTVEQRLPEEVRRQGILVNKASAGFLMIVALTSKTGATTPLELGNFASTRVIDELRRVPGVGDIRSFSSEYAMRIWLNPDKLTAYSMTAAEVLAAIREQNSQSPGGSLGDLPIANGYEISAPILTQNRFSSAEEFSSIILRSNPDGSAVHLSDVARIELGAQSYVFDIEVNGKSAAGMAMQLSAGANALSAAKGIRSRMLELEQSFPQDIGWTVPFDTTPFITISIEEVVKTLVEAMLLIVLVMFLFLQSWRATLIPTIVVPIALAGGCLGLWLFGFSINVLTLFAMVLAIGILVDDAIVVVENVERVMEEDGVSAYEATAKAMGQITSAIVGITLVLISVFVPMAFFPGSTGGIYRQFSLTLAVSIGFSAILAFTLTPALCATLLKPHKQTDNDANVGPIKSFFNGFNRWFDRTTDRYQSSVGGILRRPLRFIGVFFALVGVTFILFGTLPSSFLPTEDQGSVFTVIQAPPGSTAERTNEAVEKVEAFYAAQPQVKTVTMVRGFSFFGRGQSNAMAFVALKPWSERVGDNDGAQAVAAKAMAELSQVKEAMIFTLNPPSIPGLGVSSGFSFVLQDRAGRGNAGLINARNQLIEKARQSRLLAQVRPEGQADAPQLQLLIDRAKARALNLSISDVNSTLSISMGGAYANDFDHKGKILRVLVQADAPYRMTPDDVLNLHVRSASGEMVPFGAFTRVEWTAGTPQVNRYNGYPSTTISGISAPGYSTGDAMAEMERLALELPEGYGFEWTGLSFEEKQSAGQVASLMIFSLIVVFLLLAALYESWSIPLAVLLIVPLGVFGAVVFSMMRGLPADIYFNVGLITIIGLAAKNAILIVEFAIEEEVNGKGLFDATMSAVKLRLRPIIMTSLAFILGMVPLTLSSGAGAASRIAVGTGVMGGVISATILGVFFIPLSYLAVRRWVSARPRTDLESGAEQSGGNRNA